MEQIGSWTVSDKPVGQRANQQNYYKAKCINCNTVKQLLTREVKRWRANPDKAYCNRCRQSVPAYRPEVLKKLGLKYAKQMLVQMVRRMEFNTDDASQIIIAARATIGGASPQELPDTKSIVQQRKVTG